MMKYLTYFLKHQNKMEIEEIKIYLTVLLHFIQIIGLNFKL